MKAAPVPPNETNRLFALFSLGILDSGQDPAFDGIAALARKIYQADHALITFIDRDRQWIKAGNDLAFDETPREVAFSAHTILGSEAFLVNNTASDPRFDDNPLVVGPPFIAAYAGVPIKAPTGHRIGSLCVLYRQPTALEEQDLAELAMLAGVVEELLVKTNSALKQVYVDPVTGLVTEFSLRDQLNLLLARSHPGRQEAAVIQINVDNFRFVNQTIGVNGGDRLLARVAERLKHISLPEGVIARGNSDNFFVVVEALDPIELRGLCAAIKSTLSLPYTVDDTELTLTFSMGVHDQPLFGKTVSDVLSACETAMNEARARGRDTICYYSPVTEPETLQALELYNDLRKAIQNGELRLYFQPEIDVNTGAPLAMEALLRWEHPRLGLLYPSDFIDLAESSGLIVPIGDWVLKQACFAARSWRDKGLSAFVIAINMSAVQFRRGDVVANVLEALKLAGIPPAMLEIELTESMLVSDADSALAATRELGRQGVRLAIDDFGTGYSNLAYLRTIDFDKVKIDQSFVRNMLRNEQDLIIIKAVQQLCEQLGMELVAEGVETETELKELTDIGIRQVQGYLFGLPMSRQVADRYVDACTHKTRTAASKQYDTVSEQ